ncbi:MAG: hypothetical protein JXL97_18945 [Bacteroidales bacterium]|nr:hypothetical protein [Bacteroidales bacterium]
MKKYHIVNLQFETDVLFSEPQKLGLDAYTMIYPDKANIGEELISLNFVEYTKKAMEEMQMTPEEFLEYAKNVFFATGKNPDSIKKRAILGKEIQSQIINKTIPKPIMLETGIFKLNSGIYVVYGIESQEEMDKQEVERITLSVLNSLQEI